jgi:hypothetical protein
MKDTSQTLGELKADRDRLHEQESSIIKREADIGRREATLNERDNRLNNVLLQLIVISKTKES